MIQIDIKPDDIDKLVKEAIMKSALGDAITKSISSVLGNSYNNPIETAIKQYVIEVSGKVLREQYESQVREAVTKFIAEKVNGEMLKTVTEAVVTKMVCAVEGY